MSTPPPSKSDLPNPSQPNSLLVTLQEQQQTHQRQIEDLRQQMTKTWGLIQTLIVGLVIAILVTIGTAGWFAYNLLVQEQILRRESDQAADAEAAIQEQLEEMTEELQRQQRQLRTLRETSTEQLETLDDSVQSYRERLEQLEKRVNQAEAAPSTSSQPESDG
ncbi:hypothetical protein IQ260_26735 [Leptolyngbya cf. ectocarpi LEGE 11479]|uniref:Uncharacterized protein n=1 Tax=Leptolyngbya cf. ectocarpi LEGE 11479 TaxID=1828722 RepID=A0A928ZZF1_LEPEC|nr:hypothetical protein [Leptolyngbya ectocarpi]MBE9070243.1 hypothetical protein [Leptolyngbya cf. ectocarpi LEGE 11479]